MRLETPASPSSSNTLIRGGYDFTADFGLTDGVLSAKVGRALCVKPHLELVA
jgi:hypothetical protein